MAEKDYSSERDKAEKVVALLEKAIPQIRIERRDYGYSIDAVLPVSGAGLTVLRVERDEGWRAIGCERMTQAEAREIIRQGAI